MGKAGWVISILIIVGIVLFVIAVEPKPQPVDRTGCHYEYKVKNNKRVKVLDCD